MTDKKLVDYYRSKFEKFGVHENSLGWTKQKQFVRFFQLIKYFTLGGSSLLDVGCGFGDLASYLKLNAILLDQYTGIDIFEDFIKVAASKHTEERYKFILGDYSASSLGSFDHIVGCGIFGHKLYEADEEQYEYVARVFQKSFDEAKIGIAFDFLSDKTDYKTSNKDFHASPTVILDLAYKLSKNVVLDNTCMPFEFSVVIFKNDTFLKEKTIFNKFLVDQRELFESKKL